MNERGEILDHVGDKDYGVVYNKRFLGLETKEMASQIRKLPFLKKGNYVFIFDLQNDYSTFSAISYLKSLNTAWMC